MINTNNIHTIVLGKENIGDVLMMEPVIAQLSFQNDRKIKVFVTGPAREILEDNPYIELIDSGYSEDQPREFREIEPGIVRLDPSSAFYLAHENHIHFTKAYFTQIGMGYNGLRTKPRLYFPGINNPIEKEDYVVIAPFSRSCMSNLGGEANKTTSLSWWEEVINNIGGDIISVGELTDPNIEGTVSLRGRPLKEIAYLCKKAKAIITVETSILVIGDAVNSPIVSLNFATPPFLVRPHQNTIIVRGIGGPTWSKSEVIKAYNKVLNGEFD